MKPYQIIQSIRIACSVAGAAAFGGTTFIVSESPIAALAVGAAIGAAFYVSFNKDSIKIRDISHSVRLRTKADELWKEVDEQLASDSGTIVVPGTLTADDVDEFRRRWVAAEGTRTGRFVAPNDVRRAERPLNLTPSQLQWCWDKYPAYRELREMRLDGMLKPIDNDNH